MRWTTLVIPAAVLALAATFSASAQGNREEVTVTVNGEAIYAWEIGLLLPQVGAEMAIQGVDPKGGRLVRATVQRAVDSLLLAQEARRRGFEPDPTRVSQKLAAMAEKAGGRGALEVELIKAKITYEQFRSTVVQADLVQSLVEGFIKPTIEVTPEEVSRYYVEHPELFASLDKVHARQILIAVAPGASAEDRRAARARAEAVRQRALAGEDFAALAREFSESRDADEGGDMGFTARGQMVESFDDAVWALKAGEISKVVESDLGYHVIKVEEYVVSPPVPLDKASPYIESLLRDQRVGAALTAFVARLRESARIEEPS